QAAIIDELNVDTASLCRGAEHLGLQLTGMIPHRLPTHCGIERKDQPPAPTGCSARPKRPDLMEKTINLRPRGGCRNLTRLLARVVSWAHRFVGLVVAHSASRHFRSVFGLLRCRERSTAEHRAELRHLSW